MVNASTPGARQTQARPLYKMDGRATQQSGPEVGLGNCPHFTDPASGAAVSSSPAANVERSKGHRPHGRGDRGPPLAYGCAGLDPDSVVKKIKLAATYRSHELSLEKSTCVSKNHELCPSGPAFLPSAVCWSPERLSSPGERPPVCFRLSPSLLPSLSLPVQPHGHLCLPPDSKLTGLALGPNSARKSFLTLGTDLAALNLVGYFCKVGRIIPASLDLSKDQMGRV